MFLDRCQKNLGCKAYTAIWGFTCHYEVKIKNEIYTLKPVFVRSFFVQFFLMRNIKKNYLEQSAYSPLKNFQSN